MSCVPACEVHFENTRVPVENVLGEVGGGFIRCVALRVLTFVAVSCALAQLPVTSLLAVHWAGLARRPCMALCMEVSRAERSQPWEAGVQQRSVSPSLT